MSILDLEGATFATFVEGPSNRAAAAAARTAADHPTSSVRPLVLIGPAGVGKSHLLSAVAQAVRAGDSGLVVVQESATTLLERAQGLGSGLAPLHECGLLVLDEIEQLADHHELEGVLLELLLGRLPFGRPIILASAQPLEALGRVGSEILEQLGGGHGVVLEPPDADTRLAILRRRAAELAPGLTDEVLAAVARLPIVSVRELLAAIQRLVAFQSVSPVPLDPDQARLLIGGRSAAPRGPERTPTTAVPPPRNPPPAPRSSTSASLTVADDEFGSFLTEVVASVSHQVDRWRTEVGEAILRHGGEGFRTRRLEALLEQEMPAQPTEVVERFEQQVRRLRELEAAAASLDPQLAGADIFRDPDQVDAAEAAVARARLRHEPLPAPSSEFQLDRFGEGPGNRRALQAARSVVESPGTRDNPLVILGASGTGKTHLLHAIGNQLAAGGPVACVAAAAFAGEIVRLLASGGLANWRSRHRQASVLLLDDLHLLAGQAEAQEEFLVLFGHLVAHGRQVVVSVNAPLATVAGVDPRLLSRLEAGLVVELPRPDREIRLQVIKQLLAGSAAAGDTALADWLASRPADSVRSVQGAVHRVLRAAESEGVAPSPALAREVLERSGTAARPRAAGVPAGLPPVAFRVGLGPEKMVTTWPRLGDRLIEELD